MQALGQKRLDQLWPSLADYGDLYVTFTASAPIFVYGSVVDNVSGDAIYIAATSSPLTAFFSSSLRPSSDSPRRPPGQFFRRSPQQPGRKNGG